MTFWMLAEPYVPLMGYFCSAARWQSPGPQTRVPRPNVLQLNLLTYLKQHRTPQQNWLKYCISEFNAEQSETNVMAEFLNSRAPSERG